MENAKNKKDYIKKYREKNKEALRKYDREYHRKWRKLNYEKYLAGNREYQRRFREKKKLTISQ